MNSFNGSNFSNFGLFFDHHPPWENNIQALFCNYAQNLQFIKNCMNAESERRERRSGLLERLKICPKPPEPPPRPPRPPTVFEVVLKRIHSESVIVAREILSASFASLFGVATTQPFDALKLRYVILPSVKRPWYKIFGSRLINEFRSIVATKGFAGFYKGHFEAQRESLFQTISMFYTYQRVLQELEKLEDTIGGYPDACVFLSGFLSASISVMLLRPYATFHDQLLHKKALLQKFGPICAAYTLRQKTKWYDVFKGCFADFLYTGTQYGLRFLLYNKISDEILARKPDDTIKVIDDYFRSEDSKNSEFAPRKVVKNLTSSESLFAGALSGLLSDLATHPMDVINARLKMHALSRQLYYYQDTCRSYGQCMKVIWRRNKLRGFYPGFIPMLLKSSISTAVTFAVYDAVQQWLALYVLSG